MREIIMAFFLGVAFTNSLLMGEESLSEGGQAWILELIVFPLFALVGIGAMLLEHRKRASAKSRRPDSHDTDQLPAQSR
ncbi:MAG: hypothetical protein ACTMKZ_05365 [Brevibacterium aurantiacum]|uniref:Uncharacterized protein n=2 Tax=Brevibacterium aurantiacum TaxID=273384 RepID=A0A2A3ZFU9_BREAU|nr:hypothetical protein [Brevibacterium aurantiacum]MDN5551935.1 hypothetical protein [Brevibacterium sp.]AZL05041.1 hypothetical protein CXR24_05045 [Brevibacterium aurantiacum]AZL08628.1 hypothetical protein CXR26_04805 [Brevibacterium aurantiacum]AZL12240.1 hypothetical protein CXR25_04980 [Brevibacterium aurantiacum]AZT96466.1 hypothetical protein CXR27_05150 [Brevibacterium aurantiacum]